MANEFKARNGVITPVITSTAATGTAPLVVASTTKVANLNADLLDGAGLDTTFNSFGSGTIPVRHPAGYLFSNYFNCTADVTATAPSHVAVQTNGDNFIRWQSNAQFKANLFLNPLLTGQVGLTGAGGYLPASTGMAAATGNTAAALVSSQGAGATAGAAFISFHRPNAFAAHLGIDTDNQLKIGGWSLGANAYKVWNESNDGPGSGLNADLLDGQEGAYYAPLANPNFTGTPKVNGAGNFPGYKNLVINGSCRVAQRPNTAIIANTAQYGPVDRMLFWNGYASGISGTLWKYLNTVLSPNSGHCAAVTLTTSTGGVSCFWSQRIEALQCAGLGGKEVCFSFLFYQESGVAVSVTPVIQKANAADNFGAKTTISGFGAVSCPHGVATRVSGSMTLAAGDADNGLELAAVFVPGTVTSKSFVIAEMQFGKGSQPAEFELPPYALELAMCQRYYQAYGGTGYGITFSGYGAAGAMSDTTHLFSVPMRAAPTAVKAGTWGVANCGQPAVALTTDRSFVLRAQNTALGSVLYNTVDASTYLAFSAEI